MISSDRAVAKSRRARRTGKIAAVALWGTVLAAAAAAGPLGPTPRTEAAYMITDLGVLPHIADDVAMQINATGQVSLWASTGEIAVNAAVWTGTTRRVLKNPAGDPNSLARAINDREQVAGWVSTSANPVDSAATVRGVVYDKGSARILGTLGGRDSRANGINAGGRSVGVADLADGRRHAFMDDGKKMTDLGALPGGHFSEAYGINAAGHVAGVSDTGQPDKHAVVWNGGQVRDLGTLPGGRFSSARGINSHDQVAGFSDAADGIHAFLATGGKMRDLGTLGDEPSAAFGLNDRGDVVGASNINDHLRHAFLWRDGRLMDLNSLVPKGGWSLNEADAINDRGQIVCVGGYRRGQPHALLLTPRPVQKSTAPAVGVVLFVTCVPRAEPLGWEVHSARLRGRKSGVQRHANAPTPAQAGNMLFPAQGFSPGELRPCDER